MRDYGSERAAQAERDNARRRGEPPEGKLKPITVYLAGAEVELLHEEALAAGRSGASAQIRWILAQRRLEGSRLA